MPAPSITLRAVLLIAAGAVPGALLRWYLAGLVTRGTFPWGTAVVNVTGSFLIGVFMFGVIQKGYLGPDARLFGVVGFLGAYTTMSSFAYETVGLLEEGDTLGALAYILLNPFACIGGAVVGRAVAYWT